MTDETRRSQIEDRLWRWETSVVEAHELRDSYYPDVRWLWDQLLNAERRISTLEDEIEGLQGTLNGR